MYLRYLEQFLGYTNISPNWLLFHIQSELFRMLYHVYETTWVTSGYVYWIRYHRPVAAINRHT